MPDQTLVGSARERRPGAHRKVRKSRFSGTILAAGSITTLISVGNIGIGFAYQALIASLLGTSNLADSLQIAWAITTFGTVVHFSLVPTVILPRVEQRSGAIFVGNIRGLAVSGLAATTVQVLVAVFVVDNSQLGQILLWSAPSHFCAALTVLPQSVAYICKRFALAAVGPVVNGLTLLVIVYASSSSPTAPMFGIALASGYATQLLTSVIGVFPNRNRLRMATAVPGTVLLGLLAFTLLTKAQPVVERLLVDPQYQGAAASLGFGQKIAQGLLLLGAFGIAITSTASLARLITSDNRRDAARTFAISIVATTVATAITITAFMPLCGLVIQVLLVRGAFSEQDGVVVWHVVLLQLPWVLAGAVTGALNSYLYIVRRYWAIAVVAIVGILATVAAKLLLGSSPSDLVVPAASSIGAAASLVAAMHLIRKSDIWTDTYSQIRELSGPFNASICALAVSMAASVVITILRCSPQSALATVLSAIPVTIFWAAYALPAVRQGSVRLISGRTL